MRAPTVGVPGNTPTTWAPTRPPSSPTSPHRYAACRMRISGLHRMGSDRLRQIAPHALRDRADRFLPPFLDLPDRHDREELRGHHVEQHEPGEGAGQNRELDPGR